jgi:peptidoglycan/LPS O-acetylase OafA/YrhL
LIFALFVVISHSVQLADLNNLYALRIILSSDTAVQAFFILSGFLTFSSYDASGRGPLAFYFRRLARIYPAYLVSVVLFCALGVLQSWLSARQVSLSDVTAYLSFNLALLNFLHPGIEGVFVGNTITAINGALWTIKVEVSFYLLVPVLISLGRRISFFAVSMILISIGLMWLAAFGFAQSMNWHYAHPSLAHQLPGQLQYFGLGVLLFWLSQSTSRLIPAVLAMLAAAIAAAAVGESRQAIQIVTLFSLILVIIHLPSIRATASSTDLSYSMYLSHFPIIQLLANWRSWEAQGWLFILLVLAISGIYAYTSWHLVERPSMACARWWSGA